MLYIPATLIQGDHRVFCTYFYNHARRLRLDKLLCLELEAPTDFLNHFWMQVAVSELKRRYVTVLEVKLSKNITAICNGHLPTDTSVRSGVTVM